MGFDPWRRSGSGGFRPDLNNKSLQVLFLVLISVLLYANTLWNDFVWDDNLYITHNVWLKDYHRIPFYFTRDFCEGFGSPCGFYRSMVSLSYLLDYSLWGLNPLGFHLTNILFHLLTVLGVYRFTAVLVHDGLTLPKSRWVPFFSALVFALHPVHVESVAFVAARTDPPTALFMLASLLCFISSKRGERLRRGMGYGASLLFFVLALLTKEMAVTLPFLLLAYDFLFMGQRGEGLSTKLSRYSPFLILLSLYFVVRWSILGHGLALEPQWGSLPERLLHLPALLVGYLKIMVFPFSLRVYHTTPSVRDHPILDGLIPFVGLMLIIYLIIRSYRSRPVLGFSLLWFCVTLLPVLNISPISHPAVTERFAYIPSIGFSIFMGGLVAEVMELLRSRYSRVLRVFMTSLFLLFIGGFSGILLQRNTEWQSDLRLWSKEVERSSSFYLAHYNYGVALGVAGRFEEASVQHRQTIALSSGFVEPYLSLGKIDEENGRFEEALRLYREAVRIDPGFSRAHYNLGTIYVKMGRLDLARVELKEALQLDRNYSQAHNNLGFVLQSEHEPEAALEEFREAVRSDSENAEAHQNLGIALKQQGDYPEAEGELLRALELNPKLWEVHRSLGFLYLEGFQEREKALYHLRAVQALHPGPDRELEEALVKLNRASE